jgi:uncharacterized protein (DUF362 family)/Pyruvate/2-oxoacid:ferredoxin oxidoreductase delta subunit
MKAYVSIIKCETYEEEKVFLAVKNAIDLIGGIKNYINPNNRVLIKPNLLYGKTPEKAVTTHPSVVKAMIYLVRQAGGYPFIGDSPSVGSLMRTAEKAGIKKIADEMDCPLLEFNRPVIVQNKRGKIFKQFEIDQSVLEADVVINIPKLKTHTQMFLTLGVKNLFGCIPGKKKALWHLKAGEDPKLFAEILIDLYKLIYPSLTILDGIIGMEGDGPNSGSPISLGLILASPNALSLDQIVCDILGIKRESLLTNRVAFEQGIGKEEIEVLGESLEDIKIKRFKFPKLIRPNWNLPSFISKNLKNFLTSKPRIDEELCKACNQCVDICPPSALKKGKKGLVFDYDKCIRCFCCQEVCPEGAIKIESSWFLRIIDERGKK